MLFDDFQRVSKRFPCPVCEHADWCLISRDDPRAPTRALCQRVPSANRWREAGWMHRLRQDVSRPGGVGERFLGGRSPTERRVRRASPWLSPRTASTTPPPPPPPPPPASIADLEPCARALGLPACALARLHAGVDSGGTLMLPMRDEHGRIIGVRLRTPDGRKLAVRGSRQGLFHPPELGSVDTSNRIGAGADDPLCICEGPTDTAAAIACGLDAIGLPSAGCGLEMCLHAAARIGPGRVVVVSDADDVGRRSAATLATLLRAVCPNVRTVAPPEGSGIKDLRSWVIARGVDEVRAELVKGIKPAPTP